MNVRRRLCHGVESEDHSTTIRKRQPLCLMTKMSGHSKTPDYFMVSDPLEQRIAGIEVVDEYLASPNVAVRCIVKLRISIERRFRRSRRWKVLSNSQWRKHVDFDNFKFMVKTVCFDL